MEVSGHRESEQPSQRISGFWPAASVGKRSGCSRAVRAAHSLLRCKPVMYLSADEPALSVWAVLVEGGMWLWLWFAQEKGVEVEKGDRRGAEEARGVRRVIGKEQEGIAVAR